MTWDDEGYGYRPDMTTVKLSSMGFFIFLPLPKYVTLSMWSLFSTFCPSSGKRYTSVLFHHPDSSACDRATDGGLKQSV